MGITWRDSNYSGELTEISFLLENYEGPSVKTSLSCFSFHES